MPAPFAPMIAIRSPGCTLRSKRSKMVRSYFLVMLSATTAMLYSFFSKSKRINGFWRDDGLNSSILIFSICFARLVAWRAFDLFAEKRRTKSCRSAMRSLAFWFAACWRSFACVDASM